MKYKTPKEIDKDNKKISDAMNKLKKENDELIQKTIKSTAQLNSYNDAVDFYNANGYFPEND